MKTNIIRTWSIVGFILIALFNFAFFYLTAEDAETGRSVTTWVSYGFIHVAFLFLLFAPLFVTKGSSSRDTAPSVLATCMAYWWIELLVGILFILLTSPATVEGIVRPIINYFSRGTIWAFVGNIFFELLNSDPNKLGIIVQTTLFAAFIIVLVILIAVNRDTQEKQERHERELQYVKVVEAQLRLKLNELNDKTTARKVEQLYDYVRTSPLKSCEELQGIESRILNNVRNIVSETDNEAICAQAEETLRLAQQRNRELSLKNNTL